MSNELRPGDELDHGPTSVAKGNAASEVNPSLGTRVTRSGAGNSSPEDHPALGQYLFEWSTAHRIGTIFIISIAFAVALGIPVIKLIFWWDKPNLLNTVLLPGVYVFMITGVVVLLRRRYNRILTCYEQGVAIRQYNREVAIPYAEISSYSVFHDEIQIYGNVLGTPKKIIFGRTNIGIGNEEFDQLTGRASQALGERMGHRLVEDGSVEWIPGTRLHIDKIVQGSLLGELVIPLEEVRLAKIISQGSLSELCIYTVAPTDPVCKISTHAANFFPGYHLFETIVQQKAELTHEDVEVVPSSQVQEIQEPAKNKSGWENLIGGIVVAALLAMARGRARHDVPRPQPQPPRIRQPWQQPQPPGIRQPWQQPQPPGIRQPWQQPQPPGIRQARPQPAPFPPGGGGIEGFGGENINALGQYQQGLVFLEEEEWEKAIAKFSMAILLDSTDDNAHLMRARAYFNQADYDKAIADYTRVIELKPDEVLAYRNRGAAYVELGQHDKAITDYDEAIRLKPGFPEAYYRRGQSQLELDEKAGAEADFARAKELGYEP